MIPIWSLIPFLSSACSKSDEDSKALSKERQQVFEASDAAEKIDIHFVERQGMDYWHTVAASNGDEIIELSDVYQHQGEPWLKKIIGSSSLLKDPNAVMKKVKRALVADHIRIEHPQFGSRAEEVVDQLLSIPEYSSSPLDERFLNTARAVVNLMAFREEWKKVQSEREGDFIFTIATILDDVIARMLSGEIRFRLQDEIEPTEDCKSPDGLFRPEGEGKDEIVIKRDRFNLGEKGLSVLLHEVVHAYVNSFAKAKKRRSEVMAEVFSMAAVTLLYGDSLLLEEKQKLEECIRKANTDYEQAMAHLNKVKKNVRKEPFQYILVYLHSILLKGGMNLTQKKAAVYGVQKLLEIGKTPELIEELSRDSAMLTANVRFSRSLGKFRDFFEQQQDAISCDVEVWQRVCGHVGATPNFQATLKVVEEKAKEENKQAEKWWAHVFLNVSTPLQQGNFDRANTMLDEALVMFIASETTRILEE